MRLDLHYEPLVQFLELLQLCQRLLSVQQLLLLFLDLLQVSLVVLAQFCQSLVLGNDLLVQHIYLLSQLLNLFRVSVQHFRVLLALVLLLLLHLLLAADALLQMLNLRRGLLDLRVFGVQEVLKVLQL